MKDTLKGKLSDMLKGKLSDEEIEEISNFIKESSHIDDNMFFKNLTYEVSGDIKGLASLLIDFRRDLQSKVNPDLTDIATKYIPQAAGQLEGIIETTENAANKIMDNLETLEENMSEVKKTVTSFKNGKITILGKRKKIGAKSIEILLPVIEDVESRLENNLSVISDSFVQMSFQDLTGQGIKRIIKLVSQMEEKLKNMVISFGIKIAEKENNPDMSAKELERIVEKKKSELSGPQKKGKGLDQKGIDELLANL